MSENESQAALNKPDTAPVLSPSTSLLNSSLSNFEPQRTAQLADKALAFHKTRSWRERWHRKFGRSSELFNGTE